MPCFHALFRLTLGQAPLEDGQVPLLLSHLLKLLQLLHPPSPSSQKRLHPLLLVFFILLVIADSPEHLREEHPLFLNSLFSLFFPASSSNNHHLFVLDFLDYWTAVLGNSSDGPENIRPHVLFQHLEVLLGTLLGLNVRSSFELKPASFFLSLLLFEFNSLLVGQFFLSSLLCFCLDSLLIGSEGLFVVLLGKFNPFFSCFVGIQCQSDAMFYEVSSQSTLTYGFHVVKNPEILLYELVWLRSVCTSFGRIDVALRVWGETLYSEIVVTISFAQEKLVLKELPRYLAAGLANCSNSVLSHLFYESEHQTGKHVVRSFE